MSHEIDARVTDDHAKNILSAEATLGDSDRAHLWELFHSTASSDELAGRLAHEEVPAHVEEALIAAKRLTDRKPEPPTPVQGAIERLKAISPDVLELAEKHPTVLRALVSEATAKE